MSKPAAPTLLPERAALADLTPDPQNVRLHSERNLRAIEASLRRFGQRTPLVVDAAGVVLKGNGTLEVARRLGWTHLEILRCDLAGAEARAYAIADNRAGELAEWDTDGLVEQLREIGDQAREDAGFTAEEIAALADADSTGGGHTSVDSGVAMTRTGASYEQANARQIVLVFESAEYARVVEILEREREARGLESFSEVLSALLPA